MENVETATELPTTQDNKPAGAALLPLILSACLASVICVGTIGGGFFWLLRSGRLPLAPVAKVDAVVKVDPPKTRTIPLEPLLVNLADEGGRSYLRVAMALVIEDPLPVKGAKPKAEPEGKGKAVNEFEAPMRDAALEVLGRERSESLLASSGKQNLKNDMRQAFAQRLPEIKVTDVLFTEFLVQR